MKKKTRPNKIDRTIEKEAVVGSGVHPSWIYRLSIGISQIALAREDKTHRNQRWKKRQTLQTRLCYFSQLVLIFRPRARKTMREECFTHFIISTRAISINNACSCYLQIFHSFIGHLRCFVANSLVLIFLGLFCICAILIAFFHLC